MMIDRLLQAEISILRGKDRGNDRALSELERLILLVSDFVEAPSSRQRLREIKMMLKKMNGVGVGEGLALRDRTFLSEIHKCVSLTNLSKRRSRLVLLLYRYLSERGRGT